MASAILGNVKEEVTCPICLDLLTKPLSIDCGHSFCQACITSNYESMMSQKGESSCPVCRISYEFENLRPNRHVANIVERLRGVKLNPEEEQKMYHCARHGEKLLLFCKEDKQVICWLCERSQEHRGHSTFLLKEVVKEYQEKFEEMLQNLKRSREEAEEWKVDIQTERTFWKNKIQSEVENVQIEFGKLRDILQSEEEQEIQNLKNEEEVIMNSLTESESELIQQSQVVKDFISDLEHRLEGSTVEMLQDTNDVMRRCKDLMLRKPKTFPKEQRRVFRAPDLKGMLQVSQKLTDVQRYWVHLTLSPSNNPNIVISEDQRQLRYVPQYWRKRGNYHEGVLGYPPITSGKHYWMVDVSRKEAWYLGLCDRSYFQSSNFQGRSKNYQPRCGYWVIGLHTFEYNVEYNAFGEDAARDPLTLVLSVTVPPQRIGVFLDYEARELSFYNVTNHGFLIYKFSRCSFPKEVFPYFNPGTCPEPMTLHWPSS
ncbi:tripartite motif-containing protein 5-like isoform X1 [Marmota marmota marmota]|uniref:Tripartite motif-containing protein 5-like n=1 Tax=Marmota marmota marmota TaxID=9994 RepID=A0A8C5ZJF1_MARMA|nr:tripartite motif-containing protein 5-like isoform X1 [Marmota marmota marmota]